MGLGPGSNIGSLIPLSEPTLYILISLTQPRHGYAVLSRVKELSGGRLELSPGTLYGAFKRLTRQGLIERVNPKAGSQRQKVYRLTTLGRWVLLYETERMTKLAAIAGKALEGRL